MDDGLLFFVFLFLVTYFIPTFVALKRRHNRTLTIFLINMFLGWTFIGFGIAAIWSMSGKSRASRG